MLLRLDNKDKCRLIFRNETARRVISQWPDMSHKSAFPVLWSHSRSGLEYDFIDTAETSCGNKTFCL